MARVIIGAYLVRMPLGGYQSLVLQWLLGFHRLGHEVYCVEKSGWPGSCYDPTADDMGDDCSYGTRVTHDLLSQYGLGDCWCYVDATGKYHGMQREQIENIFQTADLFIDHLRDCEWETEARSTRVRAMVDQEPGYTQMRMANRLEQGLAVSRYDQYYTVGLSLGRGESTVPTLGLTWRPTFNPAVTDLFPYRPPPARSPFTTVMMWKPIGPIRYQGVAYGTKEMEFPKFIDLPHRTSIPLELAVGGMEACREELRRSGWQVRDGLEVSTTFDRWRQYISDSRGEFSVCKNYYVATHTGFFSDRSAAYLAAGRPVVMQDTGFSAHLPCGRGLFAVRNVDDAVAALEAIEGDYERHSRWARELACEYLEAEKVLARMLRELEL